MQDSKSANKVLDEMPKRSQLIPKVPISIISPEQVKKKFYLIVALFRGIVQGGIANSKSVITNKPRVVFQKCLGLL